MRNEIDKLMVGGSAILIFPQYFMNAKCFCSNIQLQKVKKKNVNQNKNRTIFREYYNNHMNDA